MRRINHNAFQCLQCLKKYSSRSALMRHLKYECYKEPQFPCPICNKRLTRQTSVQLHIKLKHRELFL